MECVNYEQYLQTVMLANLFNGLFNGVTATVTGCSFSPLCNCCAMVIYN